MKSLGCIFPTLISVILPKPKLIGIEVATGRLNNCSLTHHKAYLHRQSMKLMDLFFILTQNQGLGNFSLWAASSYADSNHYEADVDSMPKFIFDGIFPRQNRARNLFFISSYQGSKTFRKEHASSPTCTQTEHT